MSILKSSDGNQSSCSRFTYAYEKPLNGEGRFIHTYMNDGNPLPSFEGEPKRVAIEGDIDSFTKNVWENLNKDNKVSLFVTIHRYRDRKVRRQKSQKKIIVVSKGEKEIMNEMELKYGCNPNQKPSRVYMEDGSDLPITVLNGNLATSTFSMR